MNNPITLLDQMILFLTKKVTRRVYLIFGLNNFQFAYALILISFVESTFFFWVFYLTDAKALAFKFIFLTTFMQCFAYAFTKFFQKLYRKEMMNHARMEELSFLRVSLSTLFFLLLSPVIPVLMSCPEIFFLLLVFFSIFIFPIFSILAASVEPEDPTDSLLKKFGRWLKTAFQVRMIPQPA